ncbi:TRAFAC clade GTPase domain-containing protein [Streptomyces chrestomyceticus]|uniref:Double-GTPase 2 domain-containing protein n=1 Tax=Streptomyces chrestomyceticus TaxID=68185 RepID=A0ABU7WL49_9ACTN
MSTPEEEPGARRVLCPYCLDKIRYDEKQLFVRNDENKFVPLGLEKEGTNKLRRDDAVREAFHKCGNSAKMHDHYLPAPYFTNGEPLTVALVGSSRAGKTHLLASMIGEVERGALDAHGLKATALHTESHRSYLDQRVLKLRAGEMLAHTEQTDFAEFADGLLVGGGGTARPRPVVFFDLSGEDLERTGRVTRFLAAVDAFLFVVDPLRALPLPYLDAVRERTKQRTDDLGDRSFGTVLDRVPRDGRPYVDKAAAVVVGKSDLIRFEPAVARWLTAPESARPTARALREESRDVYAFLRHHGGPAWLKPFSDCARCTLHFASATGGQEDAGGFPQGVRPRRVLSPLLSIFAMCGLLPGADSQEVGL